MTLYKKKYRIETARKVGYDYSLPGYYFVTICTKKRMQWFGEISNGAIEYSLLGQGVRHCLEGIQEHFPHVNLDAFCIMPDHVHILLHVRIPTTDDVHGIQDVETRDSRVSTAKFKLPSQSIGSIVNQLKGVITKKIRQSGFEFFQWQPRYYDRIIRSEEERYAVRHYIQSNPKTWDKETIPWHADATSWFL